MDNNEWDEPEQLSGGKYLRRNKKTRRWYLYNKRGLLITSNRRKEVLLDWKESE